MQARTALIILTSINLLNYIDRYIISAVMPAMSADLNLTNTQVGFTMSAFMLGYFLTSPFFGYLADRFKRTHVIAGGTVLWSISTCLAAFTKSGFQVISSRIAVGMGEAATVSTSQSLLTDFYPPSKRNQIISVFAAAIPVGAALGFILGGFIAQHYGWRNAFLFAGIPGMVMALSVYLLKEPVRGGFDGVTHELPRTPTDTFFEDIKNLFSNKPYMMAVYGYAAFTFALGGLAAWIPQYLVRVKNIPLTQATTIFGLITVLTGVLGSVFGGWYSAKALKRKKRGDLDFIFWLIVLSIPLTFMSFILKGAMAFYLLIAVSEFLLFASQPTVNVVIMETVSPAIKSMALAFSVFMIHLLGDLISPSFVGIVADRWSLQTGVLVLPLALVPCAYFYKKAYLLVKN